MIICQTLNGEPRDPIVWQIVNQVTRLKIANLIMIVTIIDRMKAPLGHQPPVKPILFCSSVPLLSWQFDPYSILISIVIVVTITIIITVIVIIIFVIITKSTLKKKVRQAGSWEQARAQDSRLSTF